MRVDLGIAGRSPVARLRLYCLSPSGRRTAVALLPIFSRVARDVEYPPGLRRLTRQGPLSGPARALCGSGHRFEIAQRATFAPHELALISVCCHRPEVLGRRSAAEVDEGQAIRPTVKPYWCRRGSPPRMPGPYMLLPSFMPPSTDKITSVLGMRNGPVPTLSARRN